MMERFYSVRELVTKLSYYYALIPLFLLLSFDCCALTLRYNATATIIIIHKLLIPDNGYVFSSPALNSSTLCK